VAISRHRLLHGEVDALHVGVEGGVEHRLGCRRQRSEGADAGVGEEHVDPAAAELARRLDHAIEVGEAGGVGDDAVRRRAEPRGAGRDGLRIATDDDDARSLVDEPLCDGQADAAVAAGDERDLAFETCWAHACSSCVDRIVDAAVRGVSSGRLRHSLRTAP